MKKGAPVCNSEKCVLNLIKVPPPDDQKYNEENLVSDPNFKSRTHQLLKHDLSLMCFGSDVLS